MTKRNWWQVSGRTVVALVVSALALWLFLECVSAVLL